MRLLVPIALLVALACAGPAPNAEADVPKLPTGGQRPAPQRRDAKAEAEADADAMRGPLRKPPMAGERPSHRRRWADPEAIPAIQLPNGGARPAPQRRSADAEAEPTIQLPNGGARPPPQKRSPTLHRLMARTIAATQRNITRQSANYDSVFDPKFKRFACGAHGDHASHQLREAHKALHDHFHKHVGEYGQKLRKRALEWRTEKRDETISIDVAIHIVQTQAKAGTITQDVPQKQVDALNLKYNPYGFQFKILSADFTTNDAWAVGAEDSDVLAMKKALRKGTYSTLNLYFQTDMAGGNLGICSMPADVSNPNNPTAPINPADYTDDGCTINAGTMPGGSNYGYNAGMTAVHETGHWLGLFHVFEGYSCEGEGDLVEDTAPQFISTDGCPTSPPQDSCPGDKWEEGKPMPPGAVAGSDKVDNVHNIMDYSTDACYEGFTPKQVQRMKELWKLFREGK